MILPLCCRFFHPIHLNAFTSAVSKWQQAAVIKHICCPPLISNPSSPLPSPSSHPKSSRTWPFKDKWVQLVVEINGCVSYKLGLLLLRLTHFPNCCILDGVNSSMNLRINVHRWYKSHLSLRQITKSRTYHTTRACAIVHLAFRSFPSGRLLTFAARRTVAILSFHRWSFYGASASYCLAVGWYHKDELWQWSDGRVGDWA